MNDLHDLKRINEAHAEKFGKAAGIADRLADKAAKLLRVKESQKQARLQRHVAKCIRQSPKTYES